VKTLQNLILIRKESVTKHKNLHSKKMQLLEHLLHEENLNYLLSEKILTLEDLRGNVPTRIQKLRDKKYDAIMLAAAGVERLKIDLSEFKVLRLDPKEFIPAPAQGVLGLANTGR
jgi:hydroxymethylbilane synthase